MLSSARFAVCSRRGERLLLLHGLRAERASADHHLHADGRHARDDDDEERDDFAGACFAPRRAPLLLPILHSVTAIAVVTQAQSMRAMGRRCRRASFYPLLTAAAPVEGDRRGEL